MRIVRAYGGKLPAILVQRVVEFKLALFGKNHDSHGRELLGHGREFELRIGGDGAVCLEIRQAESCLPGHAAFADEDRNHPRRVVFPVGRARSDARRSSAPERGGRRARIRPQSSSRSYHNARSGDDFHPAKREAETVALKDGRDTGSTRPARESVSALGTAESS